MGPDPIIVRFIQIFHLSDIIYPLPHIPQYDLVWSPASFHTYAWPASGRGTHTRDATDSVYDITYVARIHSQPAPSCNAQQTAANNGFLGLKTR
jgi:hypothetical protein